MHVKQGDIIHMSFPGISHSKFFIVACLTRSGEIGAVFINSSINPAIFPTEELRKLHYKLKQATYSFLQYDSYADCSDIIPLQHITIEKYLLENPRDYKGKLVQADLIMIIELLSASPKISPKNKLKWGI
jgi:hypothetical protein